MFQRVRGIHIAAPGKDRTVAIVLLVIFLAIGVFFFNSLGKSTPEGVDADAITLRSVTLSGDDYEVVTIEEEPYELPIDSTPAHEITEGSRDFLSRNRDELWLTSDTVERLGVEGLDVIGGEAE